ncbi:hypothetical protein ILYODFUR_035529 [Ilyodon furcidens]|uniref:Uncharacterized protein n=1 Tax=Ilyodon furcidens TaxID=33524 RepID=A0ABV0SUF0_9TELE
MSSGPEKPTAVLGVVDIRLWLCMVELELVHVAMNCVNCHWLSEVFLSPHGKICCRMQCLLRDQGSQTFNVSVQPCRLNAEISPDYLNLLVILWTVTAVHGLFY